MVALAVGQTLQHWQQDTALAGLRDADGLAKLSEDERNAWRQLWGEVAALGKRAVGPKKP